MTHTTPRTMRWLRPLATLLPSLFLGGIWVDGLWHILLAICITYLISYLFFSLTRLKTHVMNATCVIITLAILFSLYHSLLTTSFHHETLGFYLRDVLVNTLFLSIISGVFAIPAWLLCWTLDYQLCRYIIISTHP